MNHFISLKLAIFGAAMLGLVACGGEQEAAQPAGEEVSSMDKIEGEVFYRERIMLPPGAELEVQLEDVSRADAMATVMVSVMSTLEGGPPYPFTIEYDPARIDERMRYALRARITVDGKLRFTNTEYIDPFSGNPVSIMVQSMARPVKPAPAESGGPAEEAREEGNASANASVAEEGGMVWVLETLGGEPAALGSDETPVDLQLLQEDKIASGFSGCNRYTGGFSNEGSSTHGTPLKFGPLAGTLRACANGDALERAYLNALGRVDAYRMEGGRLVLLAGDEELATFKPRQ